MEDPSASTAEYGDQYADIYDQRHGSSDVSLCVDTLASIAGTLPVLELGVGTGRIALPLAAKGCRVSAVDNSQKMLDKLRAKEGSERLSLVLGNFADVPITGQFGLIYVVINTIFCLLTQAEQLRCFRNVRQKLTDKGAFIVEAGVRSPLAPGVQSHHLISSDSISLILRNSDALAQTMEVREVRISDGGIDLRRHRIRFASPAELELMGMLAGLQLEDRWSGWDRRPCSSDSISQISVFRPKAGVM